MNQEALSPPWFERENFRQILEGKEVDEATRDSLIQLHEKGYCILDPEIPEDVIEKAIRDMEGNYRSTGRLNETRRVLDGWRVSKAVRQIAVHKKIVDFLRTAYDRDVLPFQTLNFNMGTEQKTHSDTIHFHSIPYRYMCGVWVALEDVDGNNGPLHYYPGSHHLPIFDMTEIGVRGDSFASAYDYYTEYENYVEKLIAKTGYSKQTAKIKKGQAFVWSANLFHGGDKILEKNRTRYSQVTHYFFDGCVHFTPLLSHLQAGSLYLRRIHNIFEKKKLSVMQQINNMRAAGFTLPETIGALSKSTLFRIRKRFFEAK